jgi:CRISP-associated protein Cas1
MRQNLTYIDTIGASLNGNTLVRSKQYDLVRDEMETILLAREIVYDKIHNQEISLKKLRKSDPVLENTADKLHSYSTDACCTRDRERLLGVEGNAARYFFREYYREMNWMGRYPRTKRDINNTLLDMGYSFLSHFVESLLVLYGFDVYVGVYHQKFYERKSLVCDVMEPFRCIIDRAIRTAHNLGQIDPKDFYEKNGGYHLQPQSIQKYSRIFSRAILDYREPLYDYVRGLYRHILSPEDHPIPHFYLT